MTTISVIIPSYNSSPYIETNLLSVLNQTIQIPYEIIVIDDCSTDDSIKKIESLIKYHPRKEIVRILTQLENKGQSAARNWGIRESKGEYIYFLDSDDEITANALAVLYNKLVESKADFTCGECRIIHTQNSIVEYSNNYKNNGELLQGNKQIFKGRVENRWSLVAWNKLFKKDFIINNRLFFHEGSCFEDLLWAIMVATKANSISFINETTYIYFIRANSTSTSFSTHHINSFLTITKEIRDTIVKDRLYDKYGGLSIKLYEEVRNLIVNNTIPQVSSKEGKKIISQLQKLNNWSIIKIWCCRNLSMKIKMKASIFYLGPLGFFFLKLTSFILFFKTYSYLQKSDV